MSAVPPDIGSITIARTAHWIAIDKPAGLPSRPAPGHAANLLALLERALAAEGVRPGVVHRLDRLTSGILLFSLSPAGHRALVRALRERRIKKEYLAIVIGTPRPRRGTIDLPLARTTSGRVVVAPRGAAATTRYETLERTRTMAWLTVHPVTGRMHQIRAHLAARGTPIAGDPLYAPRDAPPPPAPRLCLHAHRLTLDDETLRELGEFGEAARRGRTLEATEPLELRAYRERAGLVR